MGVERGLGEGMWGCRYVFEERGVGGFGRGRWVLCGFCSWLVFQHWMRIFRLCFRFRFRLAFASASCTTHMRARALLSCSLYGRLRLVVAFRVTVFPPHNHHDHNQYPTALISNTRRPLPLPLPFTYDSGATRIAWTSSLDVFYDGMALFRSL